MSLSSVPYPRVVRPPVPPTKLTSPSPDPDRDHRPKCLQPEDPTSTCQWRTVSPRTLVTGVRSPPPPGLRVPDFFRVNVDVTHSPSSDPPPQAGPTRTGGVVHTQNSLEDGGKSTVSCTGTCVRWGWTPTSTNSADLCRRSCPGPSPSFDTGRWPTRPDTRLHPPGVPPVELPTPCPHRPVSGAWTSVPAGTCTNQRITKVALTITDTGGGPCL